MKKLLLTALIIGLSVVAQAAESFNVAGLKFDAPKDWKTEQPRSSMRKAQFSVSGKDGAAEVVFFNFGPGQGGGVQANINRWLGQFAEPKDKLNAKTEKKTVNGISVTYVSAEGTFMSGPPFGGTKTPMKNYALLGAIVENQSGGDIFIKMTGPKSTVTDASKAFKGMTESAKK